MGQIRDTFDRIGGFETCQFGATDMIQYRAIMKFYDQYLDDSHNSHHIKQVVKCGMNWYGKMAKSDVWFSEHVTYMMMVQLACLFHDIGMIEPVYNYISEKYKAKIITNPGADKKKLIRDNHHWVSAEFFWELISQDFTSRAINFPFKIRGFNVNWLKGLRYDIPITLEEATLIKQAIEHHRASTASVFTLNSFDKFIRSCDGFNTAEGTFRRSANYNYAHAEDKNDWATIANKVRTHLHEKYTDKGAYAEHLPVKFIDDLRVKEIDKMRVTMDVRYPTDDKFGAYLKQFVK